MYTAGGTAKDAMHKSRRNSLGWSVKADDVTCTPLSLRQNRNRIAFKIADRLHSPFYQRNQAVSHFIVLSPQ